MAFDFKLNKKVYND